MTSKELAGEIEGLLNINSKAIIYNFTKVVAGNGDPGRDLFEYIVHHGQKVGGITVKFNISDFERAGAGGQKYHLKYIT